MGLRGPLWAANHLIMLNYCRLWYFVQHWQHTTVSFAVQPGTQPQLRGTVQQRRLQHELLPGCMLSALGSKVQCTGGKHGHLSGVCSSIHPLQPSHKSKAGRAETRQLALPSMEDQERHCGMTSMRVVALAPAGDTGSTSVFLNSGHAAGSVQRTQMLMCSWARVGRMCLGKGRDSWERWIGDATALRRGYATTHCHPLGVPPQHHIALQGLNTVSFWQVTSKGYFL